MGAFPEPSNQEGLGDHSPLAIASWILESGMEALLFQDLDSIISNLPSITQESEGSAHENPFSPPGAAANPSKPGPEGSSPRGGGVAG